MGLEELKITDSAIEGYRIEDAPDRPLGTAQDVKKLFDKLFLAFGVPTINSLIDMLTDGGGDNIAIDPITGVTGLTVQDALESLKALVDDCYTDAQADALLDGKTDKTTTAQLVQSVSFDSDTGEFTFTKQGGTTVTVNTVLEKVATNFSYDAQTQSLVLTLADGSTQSVSLSAFVTLQEFQDSDTLDFTASGQTVTASVKTGSITLAMLESAVMTTITSAKTAAQTAQAGAESALASAIAAKNTAVTAKVDAVSAKDTAVVAKGLAEDAQDGAEEALRLALLAQSGAQGSATSAAQSALLAQQAVSDCEAMVGGDYIPSTQKGVVGGVATLDSTGKVPSAQLPSMDYEPTGTAVSVVNDHNTAEDAHPDIRQLAQTAQETADGKANESHTHTPAEVGADASGTAVGAVNAHNSSGGAHSALFNAKADADHTHTASDVSGVAPVSHTHTASQITDALLVRTASVPDEETALEQSAANPNLAYWWEESD